MLHCFGFLSELEIQLMKLLIVDRTYEYNFQILVEKKWYSMFV